MKNPLFYLSATATILFCACSPQQAPPTLKVISYNVRLSSADDGKNSWEYRKPATLTLIECENPDLLGIQEGLIDQVQYIETNCPQYGRLGIGRDDGIESGELMALYYLRGRLDLLNHGDFWLSESPDSVSQGWDAACNRIVTWGCFRDKESGREICYFNTHLDHMGELAREESVKLIIAKIAEIAPPNAAVVLGGDFNSPTNHTIFRPLNATLISARDAAPITDHKGTFTGFGHADSDIRLDHIFFNALQPLSFRTLDGNYGAPYISDHYPIEATFGL